MGFKNSQHGAGTLACPMNGFRPCKQNCAWFKGGECALFLLHGELFALVEVLAGHSVAHAPPEDNAQDIILTPKAPDEGQAQSP